MTESDENRLNAELRLATQHAHTTDAERAETMAQLHSARADLERANARAARAHAAGVTAQAAVAAVRRLCKLTISASVRVQAADQARDTLAVIDAITEEPSPRELRSRARSVRRTGRSTSGTWPPATSRRTTTRRSCGSARRRPRSYSAGSLSWPMSRTSTAAWAVTT